MAPLATSVQKADLHAKPALATANQHYEKLTNPNIAIPTPPMHAADLAALVKKLALAEGAVTEIMKARQSLITGLEQLLETNKAKLAEEEAQITDLKTRKDAIDSRKREVEQAILMGMSPAETSKISAAPLPVATTSPAVQDRPMVEELTPPPMESFTPVGSPQQAATAAAFEPVPDIGDDVMPEPVSNPIVPEAVPAPAGHTALSTADATAIGEPNYIAHDLLKSLQQVRPDQGGVYGQNSYQAAYKKRKMSGRSAEEDEFAAFEGDRDINGIDDNLQELI